MSTARHLHHTYEEYLAALETSEIKLEYLDGEIFAMAGGTPEHGMICARLIQLLGARLPSTCRVLTSDVKVRVTATGLSTFPDVSVVCGALERAPDDPNAIANPALLVEVLSPSTEDYDRGEKLRHYQQPPSVRAVLLVSNPQQRVTLVQRTSSGWQTTEHDGTLSIDGLAELAVREVYA